MRDTLTLISPSLYIAGEHVILFEETKETVKHRRLFDIDWFNSTAGGGEVARWPGDHRSLAVHKLFFHSFFSVYLMPRTTTTFVVPTSSPTPDIRTNPLPLSTYHLSEKPFTAADLGRLWGAISSG